MPRFLVKLEDDLFCEWSTVVDAPVKVWDSLEKIRLDFSHPSDEIEDRINRMLKFGTSSMNPLSVAALISGNRAGDNETTATLEQIIKQLRSELE